MASDFTFNSLLFLLFLGVPKLKQQSDSADIVRHRIMKLRLDDELAALDDLSVVDQRHDRLSNHNRRRHYRRS